MKTHYRKFTARAYGNYGDSMKPACGQYTAHITRDCSPIMDEVTCGKCLNILSKCGYRKPNADLERSKRSGDTLQDFVRQLQDAAAEYLRVTRTRGNGEPTHYLPPANRSVEEIKAAENRLRALLPNSMISVNKGGMK